MREHTLTLPSRAYTPVDAHGVPTREVVDVADDPAFDFRAPGRALDDALTALENKSSAAAESEQGVASSSPPPGYDHNFCVRRDEDNRDSSSGLFVAAVLEHAASGRRVTVSTDAPGVQVYTGNFLDGTIRRCKDGASYPRWQAVCLETQAYPDSIGLDRSGAEDREFRKGSCFVLEPSGPDYEHRVEYRFEFAKC